MTTIANVAATDVDAVRALGLRWGTAWNDHDGDAVAEMCAEDLVYDEPALGPTVHGRESIREFVERMSRAYPDYAFTLEGLYGDVTRRAVLVAWHVTGTRAETGQRVEFHGDDRLELGPDGLIHRYRCVYDHDLVQRQLGRQLAAV